jgi:hypothetical protein
MPFANNFNLPPGKAESLKDKRNGFSDPTGVYPKTAYERESSVNEIARGFKRVNVELGGSVADVDLDLTDEPVSLYPNNQVKETASGHIVEYDDTPGAERVMIRHTSGSGVEMRADGTVIYGSTKHTVRVTACDEKVIVDGDGELQYNGNLKLKVAGDFDVEVGGDYNVTVKGDMEQNVTRGFVQDVAGDAETQVIGNKKEMIGGALTSLVHGTRTNLTKENFEEFIQGDHNHGVGDTLKMTAENEVIVTSTKTFVTSSKLVLSGDSGTIGGEDIVYYGNTAHIPRVNSTSMHATQGFFADVAMTAPTFNGNLSGNASTAGTAGALGAGSGQSPVSIVAASNRLTVLPTTDIVNDALEKSAFAITRVFIDRYNEMFNALNRLVHYGGVSKVDLNTRQARSKLRDPNNLNNETFMSALLKDGTISPFGTRIAPLSTGRVVGQEKSPRRGSTAIGKTSNSNSAYT